MSKRVLLVTGTPCVGKTSVANLLATKLDALYVNLTDLAIHENLTLGKDEERDSIIVDEKRMKKKISKIVEESGKKDIIVDGHYAASVVPNKLVTRAFILRSDPVELSESMKRCGFSERKRTENVASEILDVCLFDALNAFEEGKTCEIDVTSKRVEEVVDEILGILDGRIQCHVGIVDWLGKLENEGILDKFLKI